MNLVDVVQPVLYSGPRAMNPKKNDLLSMLNLIPPIHHAFYQSLVAGKGQRIDSIEGTDQLDFELDDG